MKFILYASALVSLISTPLLAQNRDLNETVINGDGAQAIIAEIWVDNWFSMWVNGVHILDDSTAYNTERSFNAERVRFNADFPMTIAFEFRDFVENDTGLEYIGSRKQQIGDGGAIVQFLNATTGVFLAGTGSDWQCIVAQHAPISHDCAALNSPEIGVGSCASQTTIVPANWTAVGFDDSAWDNATVHSQNAVGPKDGWDQISWNHDAELIWGKDLKLDNIVMCRVTIENEG